MNNDNNNNSNIQNIYLKSDASVYKVYYEMSRINMFNNLKEMPKKKK